MALVIAGATIVACESPPADPRSDTAGSAPAVVVEATPVDFVSATFPLSLSPDRRHVLDKNGAAFFVNGDTPWELIQNLTLAEAELYLTDRKNKGFNAVLTNLVEHYFSPNPPRNENGDAPFLVPGDFSTPNEAYFAHVDAVLQKALEKDLAVFITPAYLGYGGSSQGWYADVNASGPAKMYQYGLYLGQRYRDFPNIVWVMGGDYAPNNALDEMRAVVVGIMQSGMPIFTVHNQRYESGVTMYQTNDTWIGLNSTYASCTTAPTYFAADYNRVWNGGPIPFFFIEGDYEQENSGGVCYRSQAYWSVLMGGVGHFFGNRPLWNLDMGGNWQAYINSPSAQDMIHWKNLFASRPTQLLVPDNAHTVLTAGYGALGSGYAAAARASDGRTVMVYVPSPRALTIDMTKVSGSSATAWWFNPDTGAATYIGSFPTTGTRAFTPPSSPDWVLVIDDAAAGFGAPGSQGPPPDVTPPSAPSNVAPTPVSSSRIDLSWTPSTDNVGVMGYGVFRNGVHVGSTVPPTYSDTGLSPSTTYSYMVAAADAAQNVSPLSAAVSATTFPAPDVTPPSVSVTAPAQGATVAGTVSVDASASDNVGVIGVQFRLDGAALGAEDTAAPYSIQWITTSASEGAHTLTAIARDGAGNTTTAADVGVTVDNVSEPDVTPPTTPTNLAATPVSSNRIDLTWTASTDNVGVIGYGVFRNDGWVGATASPSFSDTGLSPSTTYSYRVAAADAAQNFSAPSAAVSATTLPPPDAAPPSVSVTAPAPGQTVSGTISVTATASDNVGVAGVQFRLDGANLGAEDTAAPYSVQWTTTSASQGAHTLTAIARDAAGNTTTAASVGVTVSNPDVTPPTAPTNLTATPVSPTRIDLAWTGSTDDRGVVAYGIVRNDTLIGIPTSASFSDTGLTPATTYRYLVVAVDAAENVSPPSAPVFATTPAGPPIASYNFNEGGGIVLLDGSGNVHHGVIQGTPAWTPGRNGLAISFDGVNDHITLGNLSGVNGKARVTVSAWMKRSAPGARVLLGKQVSGHDVAIEMWSDGRLYFQLSNGSSDTHGSVALDDTGWHHVALVFDGSLSGNQARLKGYVDGVQVALTFTGTVPSTTTNNTTPFDIGAIQGAFTSGLIDDVRIYDRALTAQEILVDLQSPL